MEPITFTIIYAAWAVVILVLYRDKLWDWLKEAGIFLGRLGEFFCGTKWEYTLDSYWDKPIPLKEDASFRVTVGLAKELGLPWPGTEEFMPPAVPERPLGTRPDFVRENGGPKQVMASTVKPGGMEVYYQRLPAWKYLLPCGREFPSLTRSEPDDRGIHWFPCWECGLTHGLLDDEINELPPRRTGGKRSLSDNELAVRIDDAIRKDRVAEMLRRSWQGETAAMVAAICDVSESTVWRIGLEVGVYTAK